jgi:hypothetical protein
MIDVDYLHEPLDWHDKSCEACGKDLEKYSVKGSILLCGDCRYKLSRLLS